MPLKSPSIGVWLLQAIRKRPHVSTLKLIVIVAFANAVAYQAPLFRFAATTLKVGTSNGLLTLAVLFGLVTFLSAASLALICLVSQRLLKPLCMLGATLNACALYFITTYGVLLDKTMMGNILNTDVAEATGLWHPRLLLYIAGFGLVPCLFLGWVRLDKVPRLKLVGFFVVTTFVGLGALYSASNTWLWIDKHAKSLGGLMLPWSYTINLIRHQSSQWTATRQAELLPDASFDRNEKTVVVLVIGESARARNFSMYGYPRQTNPVLSLSGAVALANTQACATYTTEALQCILSHNDPSLRMAGTVENLPSYLQRQGVDVAWRSNNWGEPPVKVATYERAADLARECVGNECTHDDLLVSGLEQRIRNSPASKVFVVLHQSGSHGPSYSTKYPLPFEIYKPACQSVELSQCPPETLVNAYDNTVFYTDHVLGRAIDVLKNMPDIPSTLLYISDHGESLGEYGLYLHGTPLAIAPDVQKEVPFVVWMSESFKRAQRTSNAWLTRGTAHSQANVFHSVLGAFGMSGGVYQSELDIYAPNPSYVAAP